MAKQPRITQVLLGRGNVRRVIWLEAEKAIRGRKVWQHGEGGHSGCLWRILETWQTVPVNWLERVAGRDTLPLRRKLAEGLQCSGSS